MAVIAVDFDGTLALGDSFPDVKKAVPNSVLIDALKRLRDEGHQLVMWTCRENYGGKNYADGMYLYDAIKFCESFGLTFDSINRNVGEGVDEYGTLYGRKITADFYIDDKSIVDAEINWNRYVDALLRRIDGM